MKNVVQKCPFLAKHPGAAHGAPDAVRRMAQRCPVMGPVVHSRAGWADDEIFI